MDQKLLLQALPIAVLVLVWGLRIRRMSQVRRLRLEWLWMVPALFGAALVALLATHRFSAGGYAALAAALAVGAAIGWWRGRLVSIHIDPETHALSQKASPVAIAILVAILIGRRLIAQALVERGHVAGIDPMLVPDGLIALAAGLLSATRLEMFLRARRLLARARTARGWPQGSAIRP